MNRIIIPVEENSYKEEKSEFKTFLKSFGLSLSHSAHEKRLRSFSVDFTRCTKSGKEVNGTLQILVIRDPKNTSDGEPVLEVIASTFHRFPDGLNKEAPILDLNEASTFLKFTTFEEDEITLAGHYVFTSTTDINIGPTLKRIIEDELGLDSRLLGDIFEKIYKGRPVNKFEKYKEED